MPNTSRWLTYTATEHIRAAIDDLHAAQHKLEGVALHLCGEGNTALSNAFSGSVTAYEQQVTQLADQLAAVARDLDNGEADPEPEGADVA